MCQNAYGGKDSQRFFPQKSLELLVHKAALSAAETKHWTFLDFPEHSQEKIPQQCVRASLVAAVLVIRIDHEVVRHRLLGNMQAKLGSLVKQDRGVSSHGFL